MNEYSVYVNEKFKGRVMCNDIISRGRMTTSGVNQWATKANLPELAGKRVALYTPG